MNGEEAVGVIYEILEGDVMNPVRISVNGEEKELDADLWQKALIVVQDDMGLTYETDGEVFVSTVFQIYLELYNAIETIPTEGSVPLEGEGETTPDETTTTE